MIISSINNNSTANLTEIPKDLRSSSRSENERLCSLDPSSICPRKRCVQKATYPAFRDTFFHDPLVNPRLRQEGRNTEATSEQKLNKRTLVSKAPNLRTHEPKTMVRQGSAFFNPSVDKLYSTNKRTLGYEVSRSLRGTSLCSTSERFVTNTPTPSQVGPGSYNLPNPAHRPRHDPPPPSGNENRFAYYGSPKEDPNIDIGEEWKYTSEKPSPTKYSFSKSHGSAWIDEITQKNRQKPDGIDGPSKSSLCGRRVVIPPEELLPNFLEGKPNPIHYKSELRESK